MYDRMQESKGREFLPWDEAKEKYIAEKIKPILALYKEGDHESFKNWSQRKGQVMHSSDVIIRLQRLNPHILVQQSYNFESDWGLYSSEFGRLQFLTGLPKNWLTEFSYSLVDDRDLPTEERRGWRTVLIYCLLKGALRWDKVVAEFGEPNDSWNEARWREVTVDFRFGGEQMVQRNVSNLLEP
jgi:hypothetical protein